MVQDQGSSKSDLQAITVRLQRADYLLLKQHADSEGTSLNSIVAEAIAQYRTRIEREQAIAWIRALQARMRAGRGGGTDSVDLLREMREGRDGARPL